MTVLLAFVLAAIGPPPGVPVVQAAATLTQGPTSHSYDPSTDSEYDEAEWVPTWAVAIFDRLAVCESGSRWNANDGNGYSGGIQWAPRTWAAVRLPSYPAQAWQATREQQIEAGWRLSRQGTDWRPWPACSAQLRRAGVL